MWEGRYKSQALLDQAAVLSCMAYVDLNPIRANIADTLEDSDFTSIQERIAHFKAFTADVMKANKPLKQKDNIQHESQPAQLKPFGGNDIKHTIPFALLDYIELVDWSGRHIDPKKKG
ncbi:transposase, partial [Pseudoalteromonas sp. S1727]